MSARPALFRIPRQQILTFAALSLAVPGGAVAQEQSTNRVAAETDWAVFVETDPKECWGVTTPTETVNTRDGETVDVRRGDILLFVTYRPGSEVEGEVSFTGGYPFANESTVELAVNDQTFDLFTEGEWAWPNSPEADSEVLSALKSGSEVIVTGRSSRGTTTKDTFSLMGVTAALDEAEGQCTGDAETTGDAQTN